MHRVLLFNVTLVACSGKAQWQPDYTADGTWHFSHYNYDPDPPCTSDWQAAVEADVAFTGSFADYQGGVTDGTIDLLGNTIDITYAAAGASEPPYAHPVDDEELLTSADGAHFRLGQIEFQSKKNCADKDCQDEVVVGISTGDDMCGLMPNYSKVE